MMLTNSNGIKYTIKSDSWNHGFEDGMLGCDQDQDYIEEMEYKQDIEDYLDGYLCAIDMQG